MSDCLIVGGGVIGLALARELSVRGAEVTLLEREDVGRQASWAGAGILPPCNRATATDPLEQLRGLSHELHAEWSRQLLDQTGIDTGYRVCGGLYVARSRGEAAALSGWAGFLQELDVEVERLSPAEVVRQHPAFGALVDLGGLYAAFLLPGEAQIRNPRYLQALRAACQANGVQICEQVEVEQVETAGGRVQGVRTRQGLFQAEQYCLSAGPWTFQLLHQLGHETGIFPVRGQMLLFRAPRPMFSWVINEGNRYLVPREDGHILVGSSEEEAGFVKETTPDVLGQLKALATELFPALRDLPIERSWAGLRPATFDGLPYLGRVPEADNLFVAAGHFRSGLHLSTGTAVVLADLMLQGASPIDLSPFRIGRG